MEHLEYVVTNRMIAEILGIQNFTNEESAILELVKNAYDAQAESLRIIISKEQMIVQDDGTGMNRQIILDFWMQIGKSSKDYEISSHGDKRVLAGAKGVGRFALARLGAEVTVYSKMKQDTAVVWQTDWDTNHLYSAPSGKDCGTRIIIRQLRDHWTEARVHNLCGFLSRTYNSKSMKIFVEYQGSQREVHKCFEDFQFGIHGVSLLHLDYDAKTRILACRVESDEFQERAKKWCGELNLQKALIWLNMADELEGKQEELIRRKITTEEWKQLLTGIGSFSAEFYFSLRNPSAVDADKFCYKYRILEKRYECGIILYRNAFSISSYEGKKDWLGLEKRARMSSSSAAHVTGSWHVREYQLSGRIMIDKKENSRLIDLANRQGLVENDTYKIFVQIILSGIQCFERYRQRIIRRIDKKNMAKKQADPKIFEMVVKNPENLTSLSLEEQDMFVQELRDIKKKDIESRRQLDETEKRYQYDIRLLNTLATSGLKAASIAHEMHNDRNSIDENVDYIIRALKRYGLWDIVDEPDKKQHIYRNIPALLEKNRRINKKLVTFIDNMLSEAEREQFFPEEIQLHELFQEIKETWEKDYSWAEIRVLMEEGAVYRSTKDILRVIFDNLILNSIQQNDDKNALSILIEVKIKERYMEITYSDSGQGLVPKYLKEPMRILDVHETSRKGGHGIGMWIVNNTVTGTGGKILEIHGENGFRIKFTIGDKV